MIHLSWIGMRVILIIIQTDYAFGQRNFEPNGLIDFYYSENYEEYLEYVSNKFNNEYVNVL